MPKDPQWGGQLTADPDGDYDTLAKDRAAEVEEEMNGLEPIESEPVIEYVAGPNGYMDDSKTF